MTRIPPPWLLAFLLGGVLTFIAVQLTPLLVSTPEDPEELTLAIPALAEATYAYRQTLRFLAVLETSDGRRLELPSTWLPGEAAAGEKFLVTTEARPGAGETTFEVTFRPVTTSARALPR